MVERASSIAGSASAVLDAVKCSDAPFGCHFKYLYNYNKNFKNLEIKVAKLKDRRLDVQAKVIVAERKAEEIIQNVKDWLNDVEKTIAEAEMLIKEKENNPRCFRGLCPNWITGYKHSKKAFKLKENDVGQLLYTKFNCVSYLPILPGIWLKSTEDYLAFESRTSTVKNVWDALHDDNIYMIGVYGMGGIGKTTLVKEVGRKAKIDQLFDEIAFIEVTETPDVKKIQTEIAVKLGLIFNNERERASKLYARLRNGKKILLILDNIWKDLDLRTVGIPSGVDRGGCKLLLTTRNLDVLERMGSINNFGMSVLNEEEAWTLFRKMAGEVIQTRELYSLPNDVCKECGGLPIAIATVARALKNKRHESLWKDALRELRAPSPTKCTGFLEREYRTIALSYNYLRSDELKKFFLISSLMKNNSSISDLLKHVVGLDILEGANLTVENARDRLDKLVCQLKDSSLLLDSSKRGQVAMHDLIRDVAITIAYTEHHVFTERNDVEREWKDKDKLKKCTKISLAASSTIISQLWPQDLDCPNLEYFCMTNMWNSSFQIPKDFFTVMPKLKVLNLFKMQQSSLPSSLDLLTNLQTLCLDDSKIKDVAIIGKLKMLKVLSLRNSREIKELPEELGQLTLLKFLDLSNSWGLEGIAPNVISKLSHLEELYITGHQIRWTVEIVKEFKHLTQLTTLEVDIKDDMVLPPEIFNKKKKLERYEISMGVWPLLIKEHEFTRVLKLKLNSTISLKDLQTVKNVEVLWLTELSDDENGLYNSKMRPLFEEQDIFPDLKVLALIDINSGNIWDSQLRTSSYQNLTNLSLWGCPNIKYAFPSSIAESFQQLQQLEIKNCRKIKYVFPFSIVKSLRRLQHLVIEDCQVLEEIVATEGVNVVVNFAFEHVTLLKLVKLPQLIAFYPGIQTLELPILEDLVVKYCGKFASKYLSFPENDNEGEIHISEPKSLLDKKISSHLKVLELKNKLRLIRWQSQSKTLEIKFDKSANIGIPLGLVRRFENLEELKLYGHPFHKEILSCGITLVPSLASFHNLKVLRVKSYNGLMNLITPSTARSLVQLREMSIEECEMVIEIVENVRDETMSIEIVFPKLKKLSLRKLESLACFCSANYYFKFPSLEELIIGECPNMKTFSQGFLTTPNLPKVNYKSLKNRFDWEEMEVENKENDLNTTIQGLYKKQDISTDLKFWEFKDINSIEIFYNQHPTSFYQHLTHLILWNCGNIKYTFPSSIAKSLHQLQHLNIKNCGVLAEIVAKEGAKDDGKFVFPNATSLKLENLPEFVAFCHTFEWPMLKELTVKDCDKFMTSKYLCFPENNEEGELQFSEPKSLFLNDKINSDLEGLQLQNMIRNIAWQSRSKTLEIWNDKSANIPLGLLQRFENMKELQLSWCEYKEILSYRKDEKHTRILTQMQIRSFSMSSSAFQNLKVLRVSFCNGLMKLITPSTARSLVQLREMSIEFCEILVEIVGNEGQGDATTATEVVFSNLKRLSLKDLKSLTCFCFGNYTLKFPSLESLFISDCPNMKTFSQGILNTPKLHKVYYERWNELKWEKMIVENQGSDFNTNIQQAYKNQVDSNLEELRLSEKDILRIWQGELPKNFGKVKTLQLTKDESTNIPIRILHKFSSLENLNLQVSSYEELLSCGEDEEHIGTLTKLKVLELLGLFDLKCIWKQDSQLNSILQNLYHLVVQYCHNLTTLLPSLASFENLRTLRVEYCNGLKNLVSFSTARSLVRLEELRIEGCEVMAEVLANEEDIENGEIVFEKLKWLYLYKLESLTCFCSGKYTLKFPNLERLWWCGCSNMKAFSRGRLSMPGLQYLNEKDCSKSDHNTLMQQLQNDCGITQKKSRRRRRRRRRILSPN